MPHDVPNVPLSSIVVFPNYMVLCVSFNVGYPSIPLCMPQFDAAATLLRAQVGGIIAARRIQVNQ